MKARLLTPKNLARILFGSLVIGYTVAALSFTVVLIEEQSLTPSLKRGAQVLVRHGTRPEMGELVAIRTDDGIRVLRLFLNGPAIVQCIQQSAFQNERPVTSLKVSPVDGEDQVIDSIEVWGQQRIPIRRKAQLIAWPISDEVPKLLVPEGAFLAGCQNRTVCEACGFTVISESEMIGRADPVAGIVPW